MNTLLRKEFRLLLPAWVATLVLTTVPACLSHVAWFAKAGLSVGILSLCCFALGILFLALSPFGQEISFGTFGLLLAQPRARRQLWWAKMGALGTAVVVSLAVLYLAWCLRGKGTITRGLMFSNELQGDGPLLGFAALAAAVMVSGGLWTTMVFRQVTAAFWFSLLAPVGVFAAVAMTALDEDYGLLPDVIAMGIYSIVGFKVAARLFFGAQDKPASQTGISVPVSGGLSLRWLSFAFKRRRSGWAALFYKELQLQQITLIVAGGLALVDLALVLISGARTSDLNFMINGVGDPYWMPWLLVPLMIGSVASVDERTLNTLQGQLCLPARKRSLFAGKLLVVLVLGLVAGAVMPWLLVGIFHSMAVRTLAFELSTLAALAILCGLVALVSFYASTLSQSVIQAIGIALVFNMLTFYGLSILFSVHASARGNYEVENFFGGTQPVWRDLVDGFTGVSQFLVMDLHLNALAWPVAIATYLWLSYENFTRLQITQRVWVRNLVVLLIVAIGTVLFANVVHARAWERFMRLESVHGPARIIETATRHMKLTGAFVLLPDGRVWKTSANLRSNPSPAYQPGKFLETTNWIDLTPYAEGAVGIQYDHTLWKIDPSGMATKIGGDDDWQAVGPDGFIGYLALKQDGTLWCSPPPDIMETNITLSKAVSGAVHIVRTNHTLPDGEVAVVRLWRPNTNLVPIPAIPKNTGFPGVDALHSNWCALLVDGQYSLGVQRDGIIFRFDFPKGGTMRFGKLLIRPDTNSLSLGRYTLFGGTNWLSVAQLGPWLGAAVLSDGELWVAGARPKHLFGHDCPAGEGELPARIGGTSEWREVVGDSFSNAAAIEKNGTLWIQHDLGSVEAERPSEYSDWIAVAVTPVGWVTALAADGTLSTWAPRYQSVLGLPEPRHRPVASVNIFDTQ